jgi:hypothetical protein
MTLLLNANYSKTPVFYVLKKIYKSSLLALKELILTLSLNNLICSLKGDVDNRQLQDRNQSNSVKRIKEQTKLSD